MNKQKKPEFRDPLIQGLPVNIPATHWWLYQTCDRYSLREPDCVRAEESRENNGTSWKYEFLLWKDARQELSLVFSTYGQSCLWVSFYVDGETTRSAPIDRLNAFELARRVRDKIVEVYRHMRETALPEGDDDTWILTSIEDEDGLGPQRRFVYEKFFVLDQAVHYEDALTGEVCLIAEDSDEPPTYFLIPKSEIGPDGLFVRKTPDSSPEKSAA